MFVNCIRKPGAVSRPVLLGWTQQLLAGEQVGCPAPGYPGVNDSPHPSTENLWQELEVSAGVRAAWVGTPRFVGTNLNHWETKRMVATVGAEIKLEKKSSAERGAPWEPPLRALKEWGSHLSLMG